jgi:peptidyl-prolyl cis-trans isomerase D
MLQTLHEKFSGLIAKIVLGIIVVIFGGFFGIQGYFSQRSETFVAMVDGHEISQQDFRERWDAYRSQAQRMMGPRFDPLAFDKPERKREVLDQLINEQLVLQANEKLGAVVPPAKVRDEISSLPAFQVDGKFNADQYRLVLSSQRKTSAEIEDIVRREIEQREITEQLARSSLVTDADVNAYLRLREQTRDFRYLKLDKAAGNANIADADIEAYYKAHGDEFMTPEKISLDYVELDAAKMQVDTKVDDATLKQQYDADKAHYVTPEERLASHILVKVEKNADAAAQKTALDKAQAIAEKAKSGKDFAALAKSDSDDAGSKAQGGDLGWLKKGDTDPAFESALFALKQGEISDPVKSDEGYHIISLRDLHAEKVRPYAEVKDELAKKYLENQREREYSETSGKLIDATLDAADLAPAAKDLNLEVHKTALFARTGGDGIAANPAVLKAAFSNDVLVDNRVSGAIELGPNHIVVVRVDQHEKPEPRPLDQVREDIRKKLIAQDAAKASRERAETLYARLQKGETLDAVAADVKLKPVQEKGIGRSAANLDRQLIDAVFNLDRPQGGKPVAGRVGLADDAYALIVLDAVADGDPTKLDDKTREAARNQLRQGLAMEANRGFVESLKKAAVIKIAEDRLQ